MGFPERLKELRLKKGLTQKEIAEEFGIKQPNYQQWESGKRKPSSETLEKFANFFGVTMDYLSGNEEDLENIELLFRMNSKGLTDEEKEIFKRELIEFMEKRKKVFEDNKNEI
jgi:putative transcriptional regulator